jgi:asparagine synthase (glutamine-hydrolysing)
MCGIAGYVTTRPLSTLAEGLRAMSDAIVHRGPDDEGFLRQPRPVAASESALRIAASRSSISRRAISRCRTKTGRCSSSSMVRSTTSKNCATACSKRAVHVFRTRSDTETIVHAYEEWGEQCVEKLRGMFAFALWDARTSRLFIARDRFGKKPLFLYEKNGLLLFASEIKRFWRFPESTPESTRVSCGIISTIGMSRRRTRSLQVFASSCRVIPSLESGWMLRVSILSAAGLRPTALGNGT